MKIPINPWLPVAFDAAVPSGGLLPMVAGVAFATTLNQVQEAKAPMSKNTFDILNKEGTGTQSALAAPSSTEEISQQDYPGLAKLSPMLSNEANTLADGEKQEGKGEEVKRLRGKEAKTFTFSPFHLFTFSPFLPLIMDEPNRPVTEAPIVEASKPKILNYEFWNLDLSSLNPDNYLPEQEKNFQQANVPVLSEANVTEQILTKGASEQPPVNLPHPVTLQPFQKSIQINNQKQDSNPESQVTNYAPLVGSKDSSLKTQDSKTPSGSGTKPAIAVSEPPAIPYGAEKINYPYAPANENTTNQNAVKVFDPDVIKSKTQSASGVVNSAMPDTNPLAQRVPAHIEYRDMGAPSTPEIITDLKARSEDGLPNNLYSRATAVNNNPAPQEALVGFLEKPIGQQSASTVSLKASPQNLLLTPLSTPDENLSLTEPDANPSSKQDLTAKRDIIVVEPRPFSNKQFDRLLVMSPVKNFLSVGYLPDKGTLAPFRDLSLTGLAANEISNRVCKAELLEINISNTPQKSENHVPWMRFSHILKDMQSSPPLIPGNLPFALPEDKDMTGEANNRLSLLNRLLQEIHATEQKITIKGVINQIEPQDTVLPSQTVRRDGIASPEPALNDKPALSGVNVTRFFANPVRDKSLNGANAQTDKGEVPHNNNLMESSNPVKTRSLEPDFNHVAGKNPLTQPIDSKIFPDTQTAGQTGTETKSSITASNPPTQPADVKHYVETQDVASLHKEETKTVDLSSLKAKSTPDGQHKNLPTNLITNEQNASITTPPPEGSVSQSVKDIPKMNNPQQIPESHYNNIMEQIAQKARVYLRGGKSDIKLRLEPPELGQIKLKFSVTGNRLEASIEVENLNVMRAIERDVPRLRESISSAGIDVGRLDIICREGNEGYHNPDFTQHTYPESQHPTEEDTDIETVEKADKGLTITGINNALDIGRIDYIV